MSHVPALISAACPEFAVRIVEQLERENASMKADKERLDWFESQYANVRISYVRGAQEDLRAAWAAPRLRELIDQARTNPDFGK